MIGRGLRRKLRDVSRRRLNDLLVSWPVYSVVRRYQNAEARRIFQTEQARMAPTPVEQSIVTRLREDGIATIDLDELSPDLSFAVLSHWAESLARREDVQREIAARTSGEGRSKAKGGKYYIVRPLGDVPSLDLHDVPVRLALSAPILRIVSSYLDMLGRITAMDLWYNLPTGEPRILSQRWHRDPEDQALVKTFLYLRDCGESNGPFCYIPGTHKVGTLHHKVGGYNYPADGVVDRRYEAEQRKVCTGKAGTLIFCDTTGLHKGGDPQEGSRFVLNTVYTSNASEPIVKRWAPHCTIRGNVEGLDAAQRFAVDFVRERHG